MATFNNKSYLFIILQCLCTLSLFYNEALSLDELTILSAKHEKWIAKHERNYASKDEKENRFRIFKNNMEFIERFNKAGDRTYEVGVNQFADLTSEEFLAMYTGHMPPPLGMSTFEYDENPVEDAPLSLDWRDRGAVTPVKSQGQCGCCWAFSAVAVIESILQIKSGTLTSLSEQEVIDCCGQYMPCSGGMVEEAFGYVTNTSRLASDADYPYQMQPQTTCNNNSIPSSLAVPITGYTSAPANNEKAMFVALANQPLAVGIDPAWLQFYKSGVIMGECGSNISHAVALVGYGTDVESGTKFWLLKNSWGTNWGEDGYFRVQRDVENEEGMCGVAMYVTYPTV